MFVKIGGQIYNSEEQPILIIFPNDQARKDTANHLINMENRDAIRKYLTAPSGLNENTLVDLLKLTDDEINRISSPNIKSE